MNLTCLTLNFHLEVRISSHFKPFNWCRLIHEVQDFELFNKNSQIFIRDYQNVIVDPRPKALETHNFSLETQIYFNWRLLYTEPIIEINHLSKLQVLISNLSGLDKTKLKGTVVNRVLPSFHWGSHEITLTVLLISFLSRQKLLEYC